MDEGVLSYIDLHFAGLMERLDKKDEVLFLTAALASSQARYGNICLDLDDVAGKSLFMEDLNSKVNYPEKKVWLDALKNSSVIGGAGDYQPMVLEDDKRIYLYRYWEYQKKLADFVTKRAGQALDFSAYSP